MILRPCLNCGRAVAYLQRGRCASCKQSEAQRGYGYGQQMVRAALAATLPAYCAYGCGKRLTADSDWVAAHVVDRDPDSDRVVSCRSCNERAKGGGGVLTRKKSTLPNTCAPFREKNR